VEKLYVNIVAQKVVLEGVPERVEGRGLRPIFSVKNVQVIAFEIQNGGSRRIYQSQVFPGLEIALFD